MKEKDFAIIFRHWIKANPQISGSYEIKDTRGKNYINYSEIPEHQINYAQAINSKTGVLIRVQGMGGEPDYIYLRNAPAYFVIKYPKSFEIIAVENLLFERDRNKKIKSLTYLRAKAISTISI